jgi:hypothetical protein
LSVRSDGDFAVAADEFEDAFAGAWDALVSRSVNGSFLQTRAFLTYHGSRFIDRSVVIRDERTLVVGCLPAAEHPTLPGVIDSHPGATFGGLIHDGGLWGVDMIRALAAAALHYRERGYKELRYKPVPHLYQRIPSQDDIYALFRLRATRYRCDLTACFELSNRAAVSHGRRDSLRRAKRAGVQVVADWELLAPFWRVLEDALVRQNAVPTHKLEEIELLHAKFPQSIHLFSALADGGLVAGAILFDLGPVRHTQYLATSDVGRRIGALDAVIGASIDASLGEGFRYFDFGTSNLAEGWVLNDSLYRYKRSFGAGSAAHEHYSLWLNDDLSDHVDRILD